MPFSFDPDSYKLSAASATWVDYLKALRSHVKNTPSPHWGVKQTTDDTGGSSGDYGVTLAPDATGEAEINLRYDSDATDKGGTSGVLKVMIDPGTNITDPIAPTGSNKASNERTYAGPGDSGGLGWSTDLLVAEYKDALIVLFKDGGGGIAWVLQVGRLLYPLFANDPANGVDGLGWMGAPPRFRISFNLSDRYLFFGDKADSTGNEFRVGTSWSPAIGLPTYDTHTADTSWDDVGVSTSYDGESRDTPSPISATDIGGSGGGPYGQDIGLTKYLYLWTNEAALTRIDGGGGEGLLVVNNGNNCSMAVPWDPGVTP